MALCHKDTSSAVHSIERYRHWCKTCSQVNMKTSSVSLSLHQEVQLPELTLLGIGKFRNATKTTLPAKVVQEGNTVGVASIFPSAAPLLGTFLPWVLPVGL